MQKKSKLLMLTGLSICLLTGCTNNVSSTKSIDVTTITTTNENEIPFESDDNDVSSLKECAHSTLDKKYEDIDLDDDEDQETLEIYYDYVSAAIEKVTGDAEEVKIQLNILYGEFLDTLAFIKERVDTYSETKEHALKELERIIKAVKELSNTETIPYLENMYESYKTAINEIIENSGYKDEINKVLHAAKIVVKKYLNNVIDEALAKVINEAKTTLTTYYEEAISNVTNDEIKAQLDVLYNDTYISLSALTDKENILNVVNAYIETFKADVFALGKTLIKVSVEEAIKYALRETDKLINNSISKVEDETIRINLQGLYDDTKDKLEGVQNKDDFLDAIELIMEDVKTNIHDQTQKQLEIYKEKAKEYLDEQFDKYVSLITYDDLKELATNSYNSAINSLDAIVDIDNSKEDIENITVNFVNDLTDIFETFTKREITKMYNSTFEYIEGMFNETMSKIDDQKYKDKLQASYDNIIAELKAIDDYESAETQFAAIKEEVSILCADIVNEVISDATNSAKNQVDSIYNKIVETVPALTSVVEPIYTTTINLINGCTSIDGIHQTLENVYNNYKESLDPYISETLEKLISIGKATLKQEYDRIYATLELDEYKEQLDNIYDNLCKVVEKCTDILTISDEVIKLAQDFASDMVTFLVNYFKDFAVYYKEVITDKANEFIKEIKASDAYSKLGTIKKFVVNNEIAAYVATFKATIKNLTSDETAKAICDKAYEELVKAVKALFIE